MKFISSLLLAITLALATISTGFAQVTPTPMPATTGTPAKAVKTSHVTTVIKSIDATASSFVGGKTNLTTYTATADTQIILKDKSAGTFADLKVGDNVTVYYPKSPAGSTRAASKITVNPTKAKKSTTPKVSATPAPAAAAQ